MRGKRVWIASLALAAVIVAAAVVALRRRNTAPAPQTTGTQAPAAPAEIVLPAKIRARNVITIAAPVQGVVETLPVEPGQEVYEGQLLGHIRNESLDLDQQTAVTELEHEQTRQSQLEAQMIGARTDASRARADALRAQAEFDGMERAYQRQQLLFREGATPRLTYEKAAKDYEAQKTERDTSTAMAKAAEDRLAIIVRNLDACRAVVQERTRALGETKEASAAADIRSPVTGMLVAISRHVGEEVTPEVEDLFQIAVDLSALQAVLTPDPATLARVKPGQEAVIAAADAPDTVSARIEEVKGGEAIIPFASPTPALRPGVTAQVRLQLK